MFWATTEKLKAQTSKSGKNAKSVVLDECIANMNAELINREKLRQNKIGDTQVPEVGIEVMKKRQ